MSEAGKDTARRLRVLEKVPGPRSPAGAGCEMPPRHALLPGAERSSERGPAGRVVGLQLDWGLSDWWAEKGGCEGGPPPDTGERA